MLTSTCMQASISLFPAHEGDFCARRLLPTEPRYSDSSDVKELLQPFIRKSTTVRSTADRVSMASVWRSFRPNLNLLIMCVAQSRACGSVRCNGFGKKRTHQCHSNTSYSVLVYTAVVNCQVPGIAYKSRAKGERVQQQYNKLSISNRTLCGSFRRCPSTRPWSSPTSGRRLSIPRPCSRRYPLACPYTSRTLSTPTFPAPGSSPRAPPPRTGDG